MEIEINYVSTPTLQRFHESNDSFRLIVGPVGSGKSTACVMELLKRSIEQEPDAQGNRLTRWVIVRNSYRELLDTTLKTFRDWVGVLPGRFNLASFTHFLEFSLPDGTRVVSEYLFRALDRPEDVKKLLSLEITGGWINEAREIPLQVVDTLDDRIGRYPPTKLVTPTYFGMILDTNPSDVGHWVYRYAEQDPPENWGIFKQPPALLEMPGNQFIMNPKAENIENLPKDYYLLKSKGKSFDHIRVYYCAQYGFLSKGSPIFPEYNDYLHNPKPPGVFSKTSPVYVGLDFGLTPAAAFAQRTAKGVWNFIGEVTTEHMGVLRFSNVLMSYVKEHFPEGHPIIYYGDPAGDHEAQTDEKTVFDILSSVGIHCQPAPTNDFLLRREALASTLSRIIDGQTGFQLDGSKMPVARKGLMGGYSYRTTYTSSGETRLSSPMKNSYSHVVDAMMYVVLSAGEGRGLSTGIQPLFHEDHIIRLQSKTPLTSKPLPNKGVMSIYLDPNTSTAFMMILDGVNLVRFEKYTSLDINDLYSRIKALGHKGRVVVNNDLMGSKLATQLREVMQMVSVVNLNTPLKQFKTTRDAKIYALIELIENEETDLSVSPALISGLWSVNMKAVNNNTTITGFSGEIVCLAMAFEYSKFIDQKPSSKWDENHKKAPSSFVR